MFGLSASKITDLRIINVDDDVFSENQRRTKTCVWVDSVEDDLVVGYQCRR